MNDHATNIIIGFILVLFTIFFIGGIALITAVHLSSTGMGEHTGYITAVEQEGYIYPNYRIYFKTDNSSSQEDVYCMDRSHTDIAQKAKEWNIQRKLVVLSFEGVKGFGWGLCRNVQVTNIRILQK